MSYYTKITKAGLAAITAAMNNNSKVPITYMAFGDGNGYIPEPDENATSLVNEVYRVGVNKVEVHNKNPNWLVCEAIIPSAVGGFNIREVALYDSTGNTMLAIASYPPTYKPTVEEGAAKIQTIRIVIQVDNSGNFELIVDPDVVLATVEYVNELKNDLSQFKYSVLRNNIYQTLHDKIAERISIKDFGAVSGTTTDQSVLINSAIAFAGQDYEIVIPNGEFFVNKPITFKNHAKIRFEGGVIVADSTFVGEAVLYCNSMADSEEQGYGSGYVLNPHIKALDQRVDAIGLCLEHIKDFVVTYLVTSGCIKGGFRQKKGYGLQLSHFDISAPKNVATASLSDKLVSGLRIDTTDAEVSLGAVVGYGIGVRTFATNTFTHVHAWGLPNYGNAGDKLIMAYPFVSTEKNNTFIGCYADTPDLLDRNGVAGGLNGGVGFYDADIDFSASAYPTGNAYIGCKVYKHPQSVNNKIIGYQIGSSLNNSSIGINTKIIAPIYQGGNYYERILVKGNKRRIENSLIIIDSESKSSLGRQSVVTTEELRIITNDLAIDSAYISKFYKQVKISGAAVKLFDVSHVLFFTVDNITLINDVTGGSTSPGKIQLTSNGTNSEKVNFVSNHTAVSTNYQIALVKWFNASNGDPVYIYRDATSWYINSAYTGDMLLEITCKIK